MIDTDIDIDTAAFKLETVFPDAVRASVFKDGKLTPHPCGVYFQAVPVDPITGLAAAPYQVAEVLGAFKLDLLHVNVYDHFSSRAEILELLELEPDWELLKIPSVVAKLFHLGKHYDLIQEVRPTSIDQLADCLALIRPKKAFIRRYYMQDPAKYRPELYSQDEEGGYAFKKAHAYAYAQIIILQLHLIKGGAL